MSESVPPPESPAPLASGAPGQLEALFPAAGADLVLAPAAPLPASAYRGVRKRPTHWLPEEDERLSGAVKVHGTENWAAVARVVGTRDRSQCSQRWNRGLNPAIDKSVWSFEEEQRLIDAVLAFGAKAWTRVAAAMGNRSDVQCRWRYRFLVKKANTAQRPVHPISPHAAQAPAPAAAPK
jgi:hypothetical protein